MFARRRDVFEQAGLPIPQTWEEVLEAARRLHGNDPTYEPPGSSPDDSDLGPQLPGSENSTLSAEPDSDLYFHVNSSMNLDVNGTLDLLDLPVSNATGNVSDSTNSTRPPFYGFCISRAPGCPYTSFNLAAILAPMLVANGTAQGFHFDPDTMAPLMNNAAMRRALEIFRWVLGCCTAACTNALLACLSFSVLAFYVLDVAGTAGCYGCHGRGQACPVHV